MVTTKPTPRPPTPTEQLRRWVRERIEGQEAVSIPEVAKAAHAHFTKKRSFMKVFLEEQLYRMLYVTVEEVVANTRLLRLGDNAVTRPELRKRANGLNAFVEFYEHSGGRHIRLLDMTREQLGVAVVERRARGDHEYRIADLEERLMEGLDVGQVVKTKFTAEDIGHIYTSIANP